ncbi:MAG TPA: hypothetical protein VLW85_16385, partial [Myxococcales bacterium]|nr:hypothetical protein [Myxococcales bacterium]
LDGKGVTFILESKITGEWKQVAKADGTIGQGFANATADLDPIPAADVISNPKWTEAKDSKHVHGQKGKVEITSKVQKPHDLRVILEQQTGQGSAVWEEIDSQIVKVSGGKATAEFDLEHPHAADAKKKPSEVLKAPTWDEKPKGKEGPGKLSVEAPGLEDGRKVRFIVERLGRDKKWGAIKTVEVDVKGHKAETSLDLKHTIDKAQPADSKVLKQPRWEKADLEHGKNGTLTVDAAGLDGQRVRFVVERLDGKEWASVGERTVKVAGGKATTEMPMKHPNAKGEGGQKLGPATYDEKTGMASVDAGGMDGRKITFTAEKKTAKGWTKVGSALATVKGGKASAKVAAPKKEGKLEKPAWNKLSAVHGSQVQVSVQAKDQEGATVEFTLERLDGKEWVAAGTARGVVKGGKASAKVTVSHPAAGKKTATAADLKATKLRFRAAFVGAEEVRVQAELQPDLDPARMRFRAELVADVGAQKLRFKAEPVPDLRPRRLRFRSEVPVPENPALTRLRVELKGGTEDDSVSTGGSAG